MVSASGGGGQGVLVPFVPMDGDLGDGRARQGAHVVEMQRRRLLGAALELSYERGWQASSVARLCERAGVSRRTFYDLFEDREGCLRAVFEDALGSARQAVVGAVEDSRDSHGSRGWRGRVRAGLQALLAFFDAEPAMARLLIVEALGADAATLELRRQALEQAARVIDEGRAEARAGREPPALTGEGVVGAVFSVVHARLLARDPRPLSDLAGPLMALIVHPYLGSAAAQRELDIHTTVEPIQVRRLPADPFKDLPLRLTYRTALVLSSIAQSPGSSSRQIADASGISDPGQISRLLTRLRRTGLIEDTGLGPAQGMARAWSLTERGQGILQATGQG